MQLSLEGRPSCEVSLQQAVGSQVSLSTQKGQLVPRGREWGQARPVGVGGGGLNGWVFDQQVRDRCFVDWLPPTGGKVHAGRNPPLGSCVPRRSVQVLTKYAPPPHLLLIFTPLIIPLKGKGTDCFLAAWIRLPLMNMNALNCHGSWHTGNPHLVCFPSASTMLMWPLYAML